MRENSEFSFDHNSLTHQEKTMLDFKSLDSDWLKVTGRIICTILVYKAGLSGSLETVGSKTLLMPSSNLPSTQVFVTSSRFCYEWLKSRTKSNNSWKRYLNSQRTGFLQLYIQLTNSWGSIPEKDLAVGANSLILCHSLREIILLLTLKIKLALKQRQLFLIFIWKIT